MTDDILTARDNAMLAMLEERKLQLLAARPLLDPWSDAWDKAKAEYQDIERKLRVIAAHGVARYYR